MTEALPPTSYLHPIKEISSKDFATINASICYLRSIYNPEVRGSRRQKDSQRRDPAGGTANVHPVTPKRMNALHHLRTDSFERAYAIKWLTALIALLSGDDDDFVAVGTQEKEQILHDTASLLALCSGSSAAGTTVRNFTFDYHPPHGNQLISPIPITVTLTDNSLDNSDFRSVGAQTWGGACVLSGMIAEDPERFGLGIGQLKAHKRSAFRILELGAGTGLVSLTVMNLLDEIEPGEPHSVEIVATDYYPSVLANLRTNIERNVQEKANSSSPVKILAEFLDWSSFDLGGDRLEGDPLSGPFDLVLGADVVYEREHAKWIHSCLTHLLHKPSSPEPNDPGVMDPAFHLIVPLRSTYSSESASVEKVFGAEARSNSPSIQIIAKDTFICDTETGEEVEYAYYKIGWARGQS